MAFDEADCAAIAGRGGVPRDERWRDSGGHDQNEEQETDGLETAAITGAHSGSIALPDVRSARLWPDQVRLNSDTTYVYEMTSSYYRRASGQGVFLRFAKAPRASSRIPWLVLFARTCSRSIARR